jgi:hypothetical protein
MLSQIDILGVISIDHEFQIQTFGTQGFDHVNQFRKTPHLADCSDISQDHFAGRGR